MILFDRLARRIPLVRGPVASASGLRGPAGIHLRGPARGLILRIFQAYWGGFRAWVDSQKNRPDASEMPRCAPQHRRCTERNLKNNDLAAGGESFFGQAVGVCPVSNCRLFPAILPSLDPQLDSGWTLDSSRLVSSRPSHLVRACQGFSPLIRSCHAFRCLAEKCLANMKGLDARGLSISRRWAPSALQAKWQILLLIGSRPPDLPSPEHRSKGLVAGRSRSIAETLRWSRKQCVCCHPQRHAPWQYQKRKPRLSVRGWPAHTRICCVVFRQRLREAASRGYQQPHRAAQSDGRE